MLGTDKKTDLLDTIPVPASQVSAEWAGGYIVLAYPRFKRAWVQRWLLPKGMSPYIRVALEENGTAVWQLIDGKRTVKEIVALSASHFERQPDYAARVTTYIMQLQKDGFIRLCIQR